MAHPDGAVGVDLDVDEGVGGVDDVAPRVDLAGGVPMGVGGDDGVGRAFTFPSRRERPDAALTVDRGPNKRCLARTEFDGDSL